MRNSVYLCIASLFFSYSVCLAQDTREKTLSLIYEQAPNDTARINALNNLANYYYRNQFIRSGDSISNMQLRIAESLDDKDLILKTYFDNSSANIIEWSSAGDFNRVTQFIQKGIDYAKRISDYDYVVLGYTRLAAVLRIRGRDAEALNACVLALNNTREVSDSIKAVVYIEFGNYYLAKEEFVTASANYNNAFDIAIRTSNRRLESDVNRCLALLNVNLNENDEAKHILLKNVQFDKKNNNTEGLIKNYLALARLEGDDFYINEVISLSNSFHVEGYIVKAKEVRLAIYMFSRPSKIDALDYFNSQPDLRAFYMRSGIENYYYEVANIYLWGRNEPDSALHYFTQVEPYMLSNYDTKVGSRIYLDIGDCYNMKQNPTKAIEYYTKALTYFQQANEINTVADISETLSSFYKDTKDFQQALSFKENTAHLRDSLARLTKTKEVALLNVERLERQRDELRRQNEAATIRKRNLQYISITIAICLVFAGILVLGMFPISRFAIRLLGYFFFISLFEFIILVLDNNILHTITHGEPLKLWLIKIGLIGLLVPIQHFLEHGITKFLESRQLLKARKKFSLKNFWPKKKTRRHNIKTSTKEIEKDTAVS